MCQWWEVPRKRVGEGGSSWAGHCLRELGAGRPLGSEKGKLKSKHLGELCDWCVQEIGRVVAGTQ